MQGAKRSSGCVGTFLFVLQGVVLVSGEGAPCDDTLSTCETSQKRLLQVGAGTMAQTFVSSGEHAHLAFIHNPVRMSGHQLAHVDTAGMLKKTSADMTFFAYPRDQDQFVSASISPDGNYWEKEKSDQFCLEYRNLSGMADFLDVGANIGTWSIPIARCLQRLNRGGSVIAVEALAPNAMRLAASARANNIHNIDLFNYAVGEGGLQDKAVERVVANNKGGSAIVSNPEGRGREFVAMTTLDAILRDRLASEDSRIFAMKMDVENYEFYALRGASSLLRGNQRPCLIFIELRVNENEPSAKAMKLLQDSGYQRSVAFSTANDHLLRRNDFAACAKRFN